MPNAAGKRDKMKAQGLPSDIGPLLKEQDRQFIVAAYNEFFSRPPDPEGLLHYLVRLRSGVHKITILRELSTSDEARNRDVQMAGLKNAIRMQKIISIPIFGPIVSFIFSIEGNSPKEIRLRALNHQIYTLLEHGDSRFDRIEQRIDNLLIKLETAKLLNACGTQDAEPHFSTAKKPLSEAETRDNKARPKHELMGRAAEVYKALTQTF